MARHKWDSKRMVAFCTVCDCKRDKRMVPPIYTTADGKASYHRAPACEKVEPSCEYEEINRGLSLSSQRAVAARMKPDDNPFE